MLTLRQIEILRAVMVAGTVAGAARLLGVSAPGISRLLHYTESSLKLTLFTRHKNRLLPTPEAEEIFEQINTINKNVDNLLYKIGHMNLGQNRQLRVASVPSLSNIVVPRAIAGLLGRYPELAIELDIIKVQEAQDDLLLGKSELAVLSYSFDHPGIEMIPLGSGALKCMVPQDHPLAARQVVTPAEIAACPLVGVATEDPYGHIMTEMFRRNGLTFKMAMSVRFGVTTVGLVRAGLGVSVIDEFAVAYGAPPGVRILDIAEPTRFEAFAAKRRDRAATKFTNAFIEILRQELDRIATASSRRP